MICPPAFRCDTICRLAGAAAFPSPRRSRPTAPCWPNASAARTACCSPAATTSIPTFTTRSCRSKILKTVDQTPDGGARDLRELILIEEIFRQRKPVLAICRGHQMLNMAFGGQLMADIRQQVPGALNHRRLDQAVELVHEAALTPGSLVSKICKASGFWA